MDSKRCVIVGGADISDPARIRAYLRDDDFTVYCDSGLRHMNALGAPPSLIIGDFDSYDDPHLDTETITLPVAKDDTDTVFAVKEGMRRGFRDFLLLGAVGARLDHSLVNVYILSMLRNNDCRGMIVDDYSEMELICGYTCQDKPRAAGADNSRPSDSACSAPSTVSGSAEVSSIYPYFSLIALEGPARGVTIRGAKFPLEDAEIGPGYQYATSNEVLPGRAAKISIKNGRLLLIRILPGAAERHSDPSFTK